MSDNPISATHPKPASAEAAQPTKVDAAITFQSEFDEQGGQGRVEISFSNLLENIAYETCIYAAKLVLVPLMFLRAAFEFRSPDFYERDHFLPRPFALVLIMSAIIMSPSTGILTPQLDSNADTQSVQEVAQESAPESDSNFSLSEFLEGVVSGSLEFLFKFYTWGGWEGAPFYMKLVIFALPGLLAFALIAAVLSGLGRIVAVNIPWRRMFSLLSWSIVTAAVVSALGIVSTYFVATATSGDIVLLGKDFNDIDGVYAGSFFVLFGGAHILALFFYIYALPMKRYLRNAIYLVPLSLLIGAVFSFAYLFAWAVTSVTWL